MSELLDSLNPPGRRKKNLGAIYDAIDELVTGLSDTGLAAARDAFPLLARTAALSDHGTALGIPQFTYDTDETYRARVAAASFFLERQGSREIVAAGLEDIVADRYELREQFLRLWVGVEDMTDEDRARVREYLDATLDPNVALTIADLFEFIEKSEISESCIPAVVADSAEAILGGRRYDGRLRYDNGQEELFAGGKLFDGSTRFNGCSVLQGTRGSVAKASAFYMGYLGYDGAASFDALEKVSAPALPSGAAVFDNEEDSLLVHAAHTMSENAEVALFYDGHLVYSGFNYGASPPSVVDPGMSLKAIKHRHYDGRMVYAFRKYSGVTKYNGQETYFSGPGYHGDEVVAEEVA